jgi:hypothetical protein
MDERGIGTGGSGRVRYRLEPFLSGALESASHSVPPLVEWLGGISHDPITRDPEVAHLVPKLWQLALIASLVPFLSSSGSAGPRFTAGFHGYHVALHPYSTTAADLDSDGNLDLVVAIPHNACLTILRGLGDGTFVAFDTLATQSARAVVAHDLDGDQLTDLVAVGWSVVSYWLAKGGGEFGPREDVTLAGHVADVHILEPDAGPWPALIMAGNGPPSVRVLRGKPGGGYSNETVDVPLPPGEVLGLAVGNLDGDPGLDVAASYRHEIGYEGRVAILLNDGSGSLGLRDTFSTPGVLGVALGRLDADPDLDLVAGAGYYRGLGDGTFKQPVVFGAVHEMNSTIADLDGNGIQDVLTLGDDDSSFFRDRLTVHLGLGDGHFAAGRAWSTAAHTYALTAADVNGDGRMDPIVTGYIGALVAVHLARADGSLGTRIDHGVGGAARAVALGDVDGDGRTDVVATAATGRVHVLRGLGDGTLTTLDSLDALLGVDRVALGDLDADGLLDLVTTRSSGISVFQGTGGGRLGPRVDYGLGGSSSGDVVVADLNGDGRDDAIATTLTGVSVFLAGPGGGLGPRIDYSSGVGSTWILRVSDLDLDSRLDVVALAVAARRVVVFPGSGDGKLGTPVILAPPGLRLTFVGLAVGDVTGEGIPDIVFAEGSYARTFLGNGDLTFAPAVTQEVGDRITDVAIADIDADGRGDLISCGLYNASVQIAFSRGDGTFEPGTAYGVGVHPMQLALGDLDRDGALDIVAANQLSADVSVLCSRVADRLGIPPTAGRRGLSLRHVGPNPSATGFRVAFELASGSPARLELIDLAGRRLERMGFTDPGPGVRVVTIGRCTTLRPGLYWIRVVQGARTATLRAVAID